MSYENEQIFFFSVVFPRQDKVTALNFNLMLTTLATG